MELMGSFNVFWWLKEEKASRKSAKKMVVKLPFGRIITTITYKKWWLGKATGLKNDGWTSRDVFFVVLSHSNGTSIF